MAESKTTISSMWHYFDHLIFQRYRLSMHSINSHLTKKSPLAPRPQKAPFHRSKPAMQTLSKKTPHDSSVASPRHDPPLSPHLCLEQQLPQGVLFRKGVMDDVDQPVPILDIA